MNGTSWLVLTGCTHGTCFGHDWKPLPRCLKILGISATIGNNGASMSGFAWGFFENKRKLKSPRAVGAGWVSDIDKKDWDHFFFFHEWHVYNVSPLGKVLLEKVIPIILQDKSTLIFTHTVLLRNLVSKVYWIKLQNCRSIAMHHGQSVAGCVLGGSIDCMKENLKAVVWHRGLDVWVDFRL